MSLDQRFAELELRVAKAEREIVQLREQLQTSKPKSDNDNSRGETHDTPRVVEVRQWVKEHGLHSAILKWIPRCDGPLPLKDLQRLVNACSLGHFCKSLLIENTHCIRDDCSDPINSRYYIVHLRYVEKFDAAALTKIVRDWNEGLGKKKFSFTFAPPEAFKELTGYEIGALAPFCTHTKIPVMMSESILSLSPPFMWFGGGDLFCKCGADVQNFIDVVNPLIGSFTTPIPEENYNTLIV